MCHVRVTAATLKKMGQFVVSINTLGKEGFVRIETWLLFFIWRVLGFGSWMEAQALFKGRAV